MHTILSMVAKQLAFQGDLELLGPGGDLFMDAMGTTFNGSSERAKTILGWKPRKIGLVEGMGMFVRAWETGREG
jgi:nucleoside-diphosphate-sugar epimerase